MVLPKMNLPPEATPWGREIQGLIAAQNKKIEVLERDSLNANKGQNASIELSKRQIDYLATLRTHVASDADVVFSGFPLHFSTGTAKIVTTTTEPLLARVTYSAYVFALARSGTAVTSSASYVGAVALNGQRIGNSSHVGTSAFPSSAGHNVTIINEFTITCDQVVEVPAGTNEFTHQYRGLLDIAPGGGDAQGDRANGILTVQFIGRP